MSFHNVSNSLTTEDTQLKKNLLFVCYDAKDFGKGNIIMITKGIKELCAEAESEIETLSAEEVKRALKRPDTKLIDIRDIRELWREGAIPNAIHAPRGMLEFWVDPNSPYHKKLFATGEKFIFFCAGGMRSALAAQTVQNMGLKPVAHMAGGYGAWVKAGGETEEKKPKD